MLGDLLHADGVSTMAASMLAVVVRPDSIDEDDEDWATALESWRDEARAITGNSVEVVEVSLSEAGPKLRGRTDFWRNVRRDGVTVHGLGIDQIAESVHA